MKLLRLVDIHGDTIYLNPASISFVESMINPPCTRVNIGGVGNGWEQSICLKEPIEDVVRMIEKG